MHHYRIQNGCDFHLTKEIDCLTSAVPLSLHRSNPLLTSPASNPCNTHCLPALAYIFAHCRMNNRGKNMFFFFHSTPTSIFLAIYNFSTSSFSASCNPPASTIFVLSIVNTTVSRLIPANVSTRHPSPNHFAVSITPVTDFETDSFAQCKIASCVNVSNTLY